MFLSRHTCAPVNRSPLSTSMAFPARYLLHYGRKKEEIKNTKPNALQQVGILTYLQSACSTLVRRSLAPGLAQIVSLSVTTHAIMRAWMHTYNMNYAPTTCRRLLPGRTSPLGSPFTPTIPTEAKCQVHGHFPLTPTTTTTLPLPLSFGNDRRRTTNPSRPRVTSVLPP